MRGEEKRKRRGCERGEEGEERRRRGYERGGGK